MLKSLFATPEVEFLCYKEDFGIIPPPVPAGSVLPEWYKHLPAKIAKQDTLNNSTIRRCAPVVDAMTLGWIIPLAADVEFQTSDDASGVSYKWNFHRTMVENHLPAQIAGHPRLPLPPMKFLNWWMIKPAPGYSLLCVPPLNRPDPRFEVFSGSVHGEYREFINFPFFFTKPKFTGIIKAGTPLVQVIPIKRSTLPSSRVRARPFRDRDMKEIDETRRRRGSQPSYYRDTLWKGE